MGCRGWSKRSYAVRSQLKTVPHREWTRDRPQDSTATLRIASGTRRRCQDLHDERTGFFRALFPLPDGAMSAKEAHMDIGRPERVIVVEPIEIPVPAKEPAETPITEPEREPEKVGAVA
jgi:hypothetical protein